VNDAGTRRAGPREYSAPAAREEPAGDRDGRGRRRRLWVQH